MLIVNKNKSAERKGNVLFINAELDYQEGKNQNILREQDIEKIVGCFDAYNEIKRFSRVVPIEEIRENDHNLNIRRWTKPLRGRFQEVSISNCHGPVRQGAIRLNTNRRFF